MARTFHLMSIFCLVANLYASSNSPAHGGPPPLAVAARMDQLADRELWPGFDPRAVPIAIFDGQRTVLLRHPSPPEGFRRLTGEPAEDKGALERWNAHVFDGRHPAVSANTSTDLGGMVTATALLDRVNDVTVAAGVLAHECFHVYQNRHHPDWQANEAELFTYPTADAELLTLRRLEWMALLRAVEAEGGVSACWAGQALELRRQRFTALPEGARGYERAIETYEGLARFIQWQVSGNTDLQPPESFAAAEIRLRGYSTGLALSRLLDRFVTGWRQQVEGGEGAEAAALDLVLAGALKGMDEDRCGFSTAERRAVSETARSDSEAVRRGRREAEHEYVARAGWKIVVETLESPIFPARFDPLNVELLEGGKILHRRMLKLSGDVGEIDIFDRISLTEPAGSHPLFSGVRRFVLSGLKAEPQAVATDDGYVVVEAKGVRLKLRASAERRAEIETLILKTAKAAQ